MWRKCTLLPVGPARPTAPHPTPAGAVGGVVSENSITESVRNLIEGKVSAGVLLSLG